MCSTLTSPGRSGRLGEGRECVGHGIAGGGSCTWRSCHIGRVVVVAIDFGAWLVGLALATGLRLDFNLHSFHVAHVFVAFVGISAVQLVLGAHQGLYLGRFSFGSFEEVAGLVRSVIGTAMLATLVVWATRPIPASVPIIAAFIALTLMAGARYTWRLTLERRKRPLMRRRACWSSVPARAARRSSPR